LLFSRFTFTITRFGSFSGVNLSVEGVATQTQQAPTPEPPKPAKGTLPKGMGQTPPPQQTTSSNSEGKSRKQQLEEYENEYLQRIEQQRVEEEKAYQQIIEAEAKSRSERTRGSLPKGFEPTSEPEPPKSSRGTLPKGF